jgi:hypothetical protein
MRLPHRDRQQSQTNRRRPPPYPNRRTAATAIAVPTSLHFRDPHGEALDSFIAVRDEIRGRLLPTVRETLGI